jgi:hypothetical protein
VIRRFLIQCADLALALAQAIQLPLVLGLPVVIQPRFEPNEFCANVEKYKITHSLIVPPILVVLARHPGSCTLSLINNIEPIVPRLRRNTNCLPCDI